MNYCGVISVVLTALPVIACGSSTLPSLDEGVVTSVLVSADSIELAPGETTQLSVIVSDQSGSPLTDATVRWTSDAEDVAVVSSSGLVEGISEGMTRIHAQVGVLTATVSVLVARAEIFDPPAATECANAPPEWLWCDDFEKDRLGSYFEYIAAQGAFARAAAVGLEGSSGMKARWEAGQVGAGSLHLAVGRSPDTYRRSVAAIDRDLQTLYWRLYLRNEPGWVGGGGGKLSRAFIFHSPDNWGQAMIAHVWSGGGDRSENLLLDPASGTDEAGNVLTSTYNDFANLRWLGVGVSETRVFAAAEVGAWQCIEAQVSLNAAGAADGVFRLWINDRLEAEQTQLNWVGSYSDFGLNAVYVENYWNEGSPRTQERYFDNFVVSTERIGCLGG